MQFRLRTLLIVLAVAGVLSLIVGSVFWVREQGEMVRDAYCLDWASVAIVQYLDDSGGRYPGDWDDLKPAFDKATARDQSFSFEEVRSRVRVEFDVDPNIRPESNRQFLRLHSGRGVRWGNPDPNERIRSRLQQTPQGD